ncbi:MAG: peptidyl-tRNA hydrolase, PTH1 family [Parcubacteria group bacterium Gr01-1014_20]|nr:MAG: peptidyl-tRNA hydrolase, PTH1 family [Parcubacteria group bacterium Gr01-1014_20]
MNKLIVGLGNPDKKYENTYHNVGRAFIDLLTQKLDTSKTEGGIPKTLKLPNAINLTVLKLELYMNESGLAIKKALKKLNFLPDNLIVVHDDSDIEIGSWKLSFDKTSAGHKGVESVIKNLKTKRFWRLRIGIRPKQKKGSKRLKAEKFVLKNIPPTEKKKIYSSIEAAIEKIIEKEKP